MTQENLQRVHNEIGEEVLHFLRNRLKSRMPQFRMRELTYIVQVMTQNNAAPDSPGRILRALRAAGTVDYRCISRANSLYMVTRA